MLQASRGVRHALRALQFLELPSRTPTLVVVTVEAASRQSAVGWLHFHHLLGVMCSSLLLNSATVSVAEPGAEIWSLKDRCWSL